MDYPIVILAQADKPIVNNIVSTDGITIAIVMFLFACFVFPKTIKHRTQFFAAFFVTVFIVLLATLRLMLYESAAMYVLLGVLTGVAQMIAMILLFLSAGGLSMGEFAGELKGTYEVIRRGQEEKEVIVPITGEQPRSRDRDNDEAPTTVHVINSPPPPADHHGPVPLE